MTPKSTPDSSLVGCLVAYDYSGIYGKVLSVRTDENGYCYEVQWTDEKNTKDWYKREVLVELWTPPTPKSKEELRDELADIQRLTGLDDKAWYEKFGNTKGLYGLFTSYHQQQLEQAVREARIDENESLLSVAEHEIELGDHCYQHEQYVGQCYACRKRKWYSEICKDWEKSISERLAELQSIKEEKSNE